MPFGIFFDGMSDANDFIDFAQQAEQHGVGSIWVAEHFSYRDAFVLAAALLGATEHLAVVPGPVSPYSRHPMTLAMGAASLSELAPGRVELHLGTGNMSAQAEFKVKVDHPIGTMREAIETIRELLSGDFVHYDGAYFGFDGSRLGLTPPLPPIHLAAIKPQMLATAGAYADGVVLSAGLSPDYAALSFEKVDKARTEARRVDHPFQHVGFIVASAAPDRAQAYDSARRLVSYLFRVPYLSEDWALNNHTVDHAAIMTAVKKGDWETAKSHISDEAIVAHTISGSPQEFQDRLQAYLDAGYDLPVMMPQGPPEHQMLAFQLALEVCGPA